MENEVDRLSELSDDILVAIISRLPFQEATSTCILSTRWRHIHTHVMSLNFHFTLKPGNYHHPRQEKKRKEWESEFSDYISRINHAIDSYKGDMHVSNAFRVHTPCLGDEFYKWLEFALSRKVEIIDLGTYCWNLRYCLRDCHSFVSNLITRSCNQSLLGIKELSLNLICLDKKDMKLILSNFVFLEHLSIDSPRKLPSNFRVVGHCKLTHLNLSNLEFQLDSIEVRDMINLVSLRFSMLRGLYKLLLLDGVPNLVHFSNDEDRYKLLDNDNVFPKISSIYHQLLHLKLSIFPDDIERNGLAFTKLINVKNLELKVIMPCYHGTHQLFPLIEACPSLEKLEIEFSWWPSTKDLYGRVDHNLVKRKKVNTTLKRVILSGYFGSECELEFLMYVMNNAVALEELIIEAWDITPEIRQRAITCASNHLQSLPLNSVTRNESVTMEQLMSSLSLTSKISLRLA